jgi:hypothetical protein
MKDYLFQGIKMSDFLEKLFVKESLLGLDSYQLLLVSSSGGLRDYIFAQASPSREFEGF